MAEKLQWEIYVPIFKNRFILKDLGLAVGLPFGALIMLILILSGGNVSGDAKYALLLIGLLLTLTVIIVFIVYGAKYVPGYIVDGHGITNYTQAVQLRKNRILNGLLITFGLVSGSLTAAGAGLMANSRQVIRYKVDSNPQNSVLSETMRDCYSGWFCRKNRRFLYKRKLCRG